MSIAKITLREPILDYTAVARPFSVDDVHHDITEVYASTFAGPPGEIVLWEHQWDWLVKNMHMYGSMNDEAKDETVYRTLWGVPVRFR